ncbi:DUF29 family protein [Falsiroseomonas sp. E2-1-a20]|uniref:DUF29 family protein n=1 Tax=Falsiroseomonas sp. E2-1-a20 TaxID=3239300 RepID=UPI003F38F074
MSCDGDILLWSEQQADLLRRMARGERVNGLDWANVAEEIESVRRIELHAVESQLRVALTHLILAAFSADRDPVAQWCVEARAALTTAGRIYAPSMAQRPRLDQVWEDSWDFAAGKLAIGGVHLPDMPPLPFVLEELLGRNRDIARLLARLTA